MASRCTNCGGELIYDVAAGKVKCLFCSSMFEPDEFREKTAAEEIAPDELYETTVFVCPNCGGQIEAEEQSAVDYCLYCGSFVTLESRLAQVQKPKYIIPFLKTKEDCRDIYRSMIRKKIYAPKEFRRAEYLEGFRGIYIPFWKYEYEYGPDVRLKGTETSRQGEYVIEQEYNISCSIEGTIANVSRDASSTFDDTIAAKISPYEIHQMKEYSPSYMYGFYADIADINADIYTEDVGKESEIEIWDHVVSNLPEEMRLRVTYKKPDSIEDTFHIREKHDLAMFPVWFLTWRKGNRVAYSVVNGENGNIYSEIPVSLPRYILFSLLTAIPIFLILSLFTFEVGQMLITSCIAAVIILWLYNFQLARIVSRVNHEEDIGYRVKYNFYEDGTSTGKSELSIIGVVLVIFVALALFFSSGLFLLIGVEIAAVLLPIITLIKIASNSVKLKDPTVWLDCGFAVIALIVGVIILILDPAADEIYYWAAVGCVAGVILTTVGTMRRFDRLVTREVPHFFDSKGGDK